MANQARARGAKLLPMNCWNGAPWSVCSLPIHMDLENLLVTPTSVRHSNNRAVATSNEDWVRGRFVGDSKVSAKLERACCVDVQRGMDARTKEMMLATPDGNEEKMIGVA